MDETIRAQLLERLRLAMPKKQIIEFAPMSRYTTLRLGGPAEVLAEVTSAEQIASALTAADGLNVPVTILGNGSNLLVRDGGIKGLVLHVVTGTEGRNRGRGEIAPWLGRRGLGSCKATGGRHMPGQHVIVALPAILPGTHTLPLHELRRNLL